MCLDPDDMKIILEDTKKMNREELKAACDYWEEEAVWSFELRILEIVKHELYLRKLEREDHLILLVNSMNASSRIGRLISIGKAAFRRIVDLVI